MKQCRKAFSLIELSLVILIIGILIAGVTNGSRMIVAYKNSVAANHTNNSVASGVKGLAFWYETTRL